MAGEEGREGVVEVDPKENPRHYARWFDLKGASGEEGGGGIRIPLGFRSDSLPTLVSDTWIRGESRACLFCQ